MIYSIEIVEVNILPPKLDQRGFHEDAVASSIFIHLIKAIFCTANVIILDSSFCVMKSIMDMKKCGVYVSSLINKRRYWPKFINGGVTIFYMDYKEVCTQACPPEKLYGTVFGLFFLKEPDYTTMLISTYEKFIVSEG